MVETSTNGHRLVLFDIDGTLLSAGRVARDSILRALETAFGWRATSEHQNREKYDFSGKTDPQIVRELVIGDIGQERFDAGLPDALRLYLEELERGLIPGTVVPKPGISPLLARLATEPKVTLGLLTGNLEPGARLKLAPPDYNRYFPFGAFGSDSADRYELPRIAVERALASSGRSFAGKSIVIVGDSIHDVACGRALGVRAVGVATGITSLERLAAEKPDALLADFSDSERSLEAILG
jgi:phosphoglycolate phosphatase-like HAD superfamily hydrolase